MLHLTHLKYMVVEADEDEKRKSTPERLQGQTDGLTLSTFEQRFYRARISD